MLSESVKEAVNSFKRMPTMYVYFSVLATLFCLLSLLSGIGLLILVFFLFSIINYSLLSLPGLVIGVIIALGTFWFMSGVEGATIRFYYNLLSGRNYNLQSGFTEFLSYILGNASEFFLISLVRAIIAAIPLLLLFIIYTMLQQYNVPYVDVLLSIIGLGMLFIIYFLLFPVFISLAVYDTAGLKAAFKNSIRVLSRGHIKALVLYAAYCFVWVLNFIPILNLFTLFIAYPIIYTSLIALFRRIVK